jgi:predicted lysophospholipase L1 biosynthesis ABC-type transport system permease subunit
LGSAPPPGFAKALAAAPRDRDLSVLVDMRVDVFPMNGVPVTAFSLAPVVGHVPMVTTDGHPPANPDEISVGPQTAAQLHLRPGSTVDVAGRQLTVSGITYMPQDFHTGYTEGAWVPSATFRTLAPDPAEDKYHEVRFGFRAGVDPTAALKRLPANLAPGGAGPAAAVTQIDVQIELRSVRLQPLLLGAFLVLLALAAVGHGLVTAVRRRRHDVAVLRAVGMTRRQARATVAVQATVLAMFGLVVGIPLGIAVGRSSWQWLAAATPVVYVAPLAAVAVYLAVPASIAVANFLAAWPARRAARLRVADVLRAE